MTFILVPQTYPLSAVDEQCKASSEGPPTEPKIKVAPVDVLRRPKMLVVTKATLNHGGKTVISE